MGSKSPEGHQQDQPLHISKDPAPAIVPKFRNAEAPDDDLGGDDGDDDDDDDDGGDEPADGDGALSPAGNEKKKKKRKRSKKKPKKASPNEDPVQQTDPPTIPVSNFYPNNTYLPGEIQPYPNLHRTTAEETRHTTRLESTLSPSALQDFRHAAAVHRQVRAHARSLAKPGVPLTSLADAIDDSVRSLVGHPGLLPGDGLKAGLAFPTGLALNECAAHWTPGPGSGGRNDRVLQKGDVLKVDFGVHVGGRIVDSAFSLAWEERFDPLLQAVREATDTGVREAGIDACVGEIGAKVQEVMESFEVEAGKGKVVPVRAVRGLAGHDIRPYRIHGDKQVPFVRSGDRTRMEEGEVFAIETFGSTGKGSVRDGAGVYGYGRNPDAPMTHLQLSSARSLLKTIDEHFGTIVFCRRYLERLGVEKYLLGLNSLVSHDIVRSYGPLNDIDGSHVAQFEHTILLRPDAKEVVSRGDDY